MLASCLLVTSLLTSGGYAQVIANSSAPSATTCECGEGGNATAFVTSLADLSSRLKPFADGKEPLLAAPLQQSSFDVPVPNFDCIGWNTAADMWHQFETLLQIQADFILRTYNEVPDGVSDLYYFLVLEIDTLDDQIRDVIGDLNAIFDNIACCADPEKVKNATESVNSLNEAISKLRSKTGDSLVPLVSWNFNITGVCSP